MVVPIKIRGIIFSVELILCVDVKPGIWSLELGEFIVLVSHFGGLPFWIVRAHAVGVRDSERSDLIELGDS